MSGAPYGLSSFPNAIHEAFASTAITISAGDKGKADVFASDMADTLTPAQRSERMSRIKGRDTKPELAIRRGLHALGFRYVLHDKRLPGRPDIYLPKWNAAIYVHGCMWHGHGCSLYREPKSNVDFWRAKIAGNVERDRRKLNELLAEGVRVCTVWECAIKGKTRLPVGTAIERIAEWIKCGGLQLVVAGSERDSQDL